MSTEASHPFRLTKTIDLAFLADPQSESEAHSIAHFPWDALSVQTLWAGDLDKPEFQEDWRAMVNLWSGTMVVGGSDAVAVVSPTHPSNGFCVKVNQNADQRKEPFRAVAWALSILAPFDPLIVCSQGRVLYVLNVKRKAVVGKLRGHGGDITAIAVHPSFPYLICTCSRDFSARLYDLTMPPCESPNNPHWPPSTVPSLGGAPHGLQSSEPEGVETGRCVAVLCGGPSGGHNAAVLNASFHPTYPLVATCGLDRAVKIWLLPKMSPEEMAREDKPLFSSTRIHQARIMSVNWLSPDVLETHSAPALMRCNGKKKEDLYHVDGTIVIWRWLSFDRFFPPNQPKPTKVMRGCASDYQESSSFKLLSVAPISQLTRHLHVACTLRNNYVFALTLPDRIRLYNVADFQPRQRPPFPLDENGADEINDLSRLHLDDEEGDEEERAVASVATQGAAISPPLKEHDIVVPANCKLQAASFGYHGLSLIALGANGRIWIWTSAVDCIQPSETGSL